DRQRGKTALRVKVGGTGRRLCGYRWAGREDGSAGNGGRDEKTVGGTGRQALRAGVGRKIGSAGRRLCG
ncbi:MAG TPA: hypothetical protein VHE54_05275, partial [Puia sp.]|nr:hypothetical protein [Puia sp.]